MQIERKHLSLKSGSEYRIIRAKVFFVAKFKMSLRFIDYSNWHECFPPSKLLTLLKK